MTHNNQAFTLVELVVVTTIIAILATIGFTAYTGYISGARDTSRITQLTDMHSGLQQYAASSRLPLPDESVDITLSGSVFAYQGNLSKAIIDTIGYQGGKDPEHGIYPVYMLSESKRDFQLMTFLDDQRISLLPHIHTYADIGDYSILYPKTIGSPLGILLESDTKQPLHNLSSVSASGSYDIILGSEDIASYLSDSDILNSTSDNLQVLIPNQSCKRILDMGKSTGSKQYIINPTGSKKIRVYCDMLTDGGGWTLVGTTDGNFAPAGLLDEAIGNTPQNINPGADYSINASDILFDEVRMGGDGDQQKYFGFYTPDGFIQSRGFEQLDGGSETCIEHSAYYTYDSGKTRYWNQYYMYEESLITNRRDHVSGGIDLGSTSGCSSSGNSFALYKVSNSHACAYGNCSNPNSSWSAPGSTQKTPTLSSMDPSNFPDIGEANVYVMVR